MNDQDKKAFKEWNDLPVDQIMPHEQYIKWIKEGKSCTECFIEIAWNAGCQHKQKEIDKLNKILKVIGEKLIPFSNYSEIAKIIQEIKGLYEISKQDS